jgi:hypothetical protein
VIEIAARRQNGEELGMAVDLTVYLSDQPGELARLGNVLGAANVNIDGMCAVTSAGGEGEVHILVADAAAAFEALANAGIEIASEQEVLVVPIEDRPGALGDVARRLGEARVNISTTYLATGTRLVLAADDLASTIAALT